MSPWPLTTACRRPPGSAVRAWALHLTSLCLLAGLAGCSTIESYPGTVDSSFPESIPAPTEPSSVTPAAAESADETTVPPIPPTPETAPVEPAAQRVLVVLSSDADNYRGVSEALSSNLPDHYELLEINLAAGDVEKQAADIAASEWAAAVAIGADAADFAASRLQIPVVLCQVFDFEGLLLQHDNFVGVEPLPPLDLQLKSWKQLDPDATRVGIIVGPDETGLLARAEEAAAGLGLQLHPAVAMTDQDALYQFKRFAEDVDALWLQPNGRILSPSVLHEMLDYARRHQVQTIVFNRALLDWGALLSVGSDPAAVAASVASALQAIVGGNAGLARIFPLASVDLHFNEQVAGEIGAIGPSDVARARQLNMASDDDS